MSYHGKLQVLKNGTADAEIQLWAYQQLEKEFNLTDEEIKQIFQEQTGFFFDDNPADDLALMDFARALLRKASE